MQKIENKNLNRLRYASQKSYSIEFGYTARRRSLIEDAKFEHNVLKTSVDPVEEIECELTNSGENISLYKLIVSIENQQTALIKLIDALQENNAIIEHIETRHSSKSKFRFDIYLEIKCNTLEYSKILSTLRNTPNCFSDVSLIKSTEDSLDIKKNSEQLWIPFSIWDLDYCNHLNINYEPDIDSRHPGFSDMEYRKRRQQIADIAFSYKHGDPIPKVVYADDEIKTWNLIYNQLNEMYTSYACKEHIEAFKQLEDANIYSPHFIPQLEDVSKFLKKKSGFQLRPVAGLLSARDFLASLAFRVFQCTQYIRHSSSPLHSPEPDCVHELLGHVPLLSNPGFAEFSQQIGMASLGVSDEDIIKLSTLYWFTVEFGICKENDEIKAYGAGLLSAFGELKYALSGQPELKPFEADKTALQTYQDEDYQPIYFVAESFEEAKEQLRKYSKNIKRPYQVRYDPFTQSIKIVDNMETIQEIQRSIQVDTELMLRSIERLNELKL